MFLYSSHALTCSPLPSVRMIRLPTPLDFADRQSLYGNPMTYNCRVSFVSPCLGASPSIFEIFALHFGSRRAAAAPSPFGLALAPPPPPPIRWRSPPPPSIRRSHVGPTLASRFRCIAMRVGAPSRRFAALIFPDRDQLCSRFNRGPTTLSWAHRYRCAVGRGGWGLSFPAGGEGPSGRERRH